MRRFLAILILFSAGALLPCPARAQFLGYTSPQTVQQSLANNVNCTGAAQNFNVQNLGQTQHFASASPSNVTSFQMVIQGVDNLGSVYPISDYGKLAQTGSLALVSISGSGYFPVIRVQVTCSPNTAFFMLSYSGASGTPLVSVGSYQTGQLAKSIFSGIAANANFTDQQFQPPFANTSGTLQFSYVGNAVAGSTVTLTCPSQIPNTGALYSQTFALANFAGAQGQVFQVPPNSCPFLIVSYTTGGATAGTAYLNYIFNLPGVPGTSVDPCQSNAVPKSSAVITAPAAATTQIVALTNGTTIYPCGFSLSGAGAAGTAKFVTGTGSSCGTGQTDLTGAYPTAIGGSISYGGGGITIMNVPGSQAVCIIMVTASATAAGMLTYVKQ